MDALTLNEEDNDDQSEQSLPTELIYDILTRLPTKPLLQFKSVSKQWQSLISSPSFIKHHSITNNHRTPSLLLIAYDTSTRHRHFLSTSRADVTATHLMTLTEVPHAHCKMTETEHLHGLVLLKSGKGFIWNYFAFLINPSMHKYVKLMAPGSLSVYDYRKVHICYFFGYDEVRNEHKVLNIKMLDVKLLRPFKPSSVEIMLFELGTFEWRKIDAEIPVDISGEDWYYGMKQSVCVNSVIHFMLQSRNEVLAFDLVREIFEIIKIPNEALPSEDRTVYDGKGFREIKSNQPILMKVNGFLGVLCHDRVVESNEMDIWMLKDYEERVWVKETIVFGESWVDLEGPFPSDCVNVDEIAFAPIRVCRNLIRVPIYDMKTRSFKSVKYFLGEQFLHAKTVEFDQISSYVESMLPLEMNATTSS